MTYNMTYIKAILIQCVKCGDSYPPIDNTNPEFDKWINGEYDNKPCPHCKMKKEMILNEISREYKK